MSKARVSKAAAETKTSSSSSDHCFSSVDSSIVLVAAIFEDECFKDDCPVYCRISSAHCL